MSEWTDVQWIPVEGRRPSREDGPTCLEGAKVVVRVLTVDMLINGKPPDTRGYHLAAMAFDDDEQGKDRIMFWAPCNGTEDLSYYPLDEQPTAEAGSARH